MNGDRTGKMGTGTRTKTRQERGRRYEVIEVCRYVDMDDNREEGGGQGARTETEKERDREREPGNLPSDSKGGAEDAREGMAPMGNQQPQPQHSTPSREHRIMKRTRSKEWVTRDGIREREEGRRGATNRTRTIEAKRRSKTRESMYVCT